jgi:hypothetical protein
MIALGLDAFTYAHPNPTPPSLLHLHSLMTVDLVIRRSRSPNPKPSPPSSSRTTPPYLLAFSYLSLAGRLLPPPPLLPLPPLPLLPPLLSHKSRSSLFHLSCRPSASSLCLLPLVFPLCPLPLSLPNRSEVSWQPRATAVAHKIWWLWRQLARAWRDSIVADSVAVAVGWWR